MSVVTKGRRSSAGERPVSYRPRWVTLAVCASFFGLYLCTYLLVRDAGLLARSRAALVADASPPVDASDVSWRFRIEAPRAQTWGAWCRVPFYPLVRSEEFLCDRVETFAAEDKARTLALLREHGSLAQAR